MLGEGRALWMPMSMSRGCGEGMQLPVKEAAFEAWEELRLKLRCGMNESINQLETETVLAIEMYDHGYHCSAFLRGVSWTNYFSVMRCHDPRILLCTWCYLRAYREFMSDRKAERGAHPLFNTLK
jgi:hypothetical protein